MKNVDETIRKSLQKLKVYEINKLRKIESEQKAFFQEIRENLQEQLSVKKSQDDLLSPKQIVKELGISRKTFDRWVNDGLSIFQRDPGASIRVKRKDLETYLNGRYNVR